MKVPVYTIQKTEVEKKQLPAVFDAEVRPDLIKRAILAIRANSRQAYGADPEAGQKHIGKLSRRRHDYKSSYGHGISRVPRKILTARGTRFHWVGAVAPGTVGGRRAHPPKVEKNWEQKVNRKEKKQALRGALAASMVKELVAECGHSVPDHYPFIVESKFEELSKTKDVIAALAKLGFEQELERASKKKMKTGRARLRGRKYKRAKGPLLVVSGKCGLQRAAKNIPGIEVVNVKFINTELLAPGVKPGRATIFTDAAIEKITKEKLFE